MTILRCAVGALSVLAAVPVHAVELPRFGDVPLSDATESCLETHAVGAVLDAAREDRKAAFQMVAEGLMSLEPADRKKYFRYHDDEIWPTHAAQASYQGAVNFVPAGVLPSCYAVGMHWVREGHNISTTCAESKKECAALFSEQEQEMVKEALKEAKASRDDHRDAFFRYLLSHEEELESWRSPLPFLMKACNYPQQATAESRFIDGTDLLVARWSCLQVRAIITRTEVESFETGCDTSWTSVEGDAGKVIGSTFTDLGLTDRYREEQLETLLDRLTRMDPSAATCEADWAMNWRKSLVDLWREASQMKACYDKKLAVPDRAAICPELYDEQSMECMGGNAESCSLVAQMHFEGLGGLEVDVPVALSQYNKACNGEHAPGCEALKAQVATVDGWIEEKMAAASPEGWPPETAPNGDGQADAEPDAAGSTEGQGEPGPDGSEDAEPPVYEAPEGAEGAMKSAFGLIRTYGGSLGDDWTRAHARKLFDLAMVIQHGDMAEDVIGEWESLFDTAWLDEVTPKVSELVEAAASEAPQ